MDMTVNGKSLTEILKLISAPATCEPDKLMDKYSYYSIPVYEERLNLVLGRENYLVEYGKIDSCILPNGQVMLSTNCTISLLNSERERVFTASGIGTYEISSAKENGRFQGIQNAGVCLQFSAFKSACKDMQIFNLHEDEFSPAFSEKSTKNVSNQPSTEQPRKEVFYTEGKMQEIRVDKKTNKPVYTIQAHKKVGSVMEEKTSVIIFYPNQYKNCVEQLNDFIIKCQDAKLHELRILVKELEPDQNGISQLIFKGFTN